MGEPELPVKDWKGWLSASDIEDIAKKLHLPLQGVFSKDELPRNPVVGSYIINLQDADDGNGTHWTFFRVFKGNRACYFDPFGLNMPEDIRDFLSKYEPIAWNNRQIQDIKSDKCGLFCISCDYYFQYDCKRPDKYECFDDFLNMWSITPTLNDKILKEYLTE
tara:strand:+ start:15349 stop:15837 length:489 start_codon:yes stop_codon:yes gene_type:complete